MSAGAATSLTTYVYDVFGDRIEKDLWSSGTTTILRFAYDVGGSSPSAGDGLGSAGNLWADLNGSGSLLERYIFGDSVDQLFARIFSTGTAAWYLTDRLGSVRDITDNTGAVIDHLGITENKSSNRQLAAGIDGKQKRHYRLHANQSQVSKWPQSKVGEMRCFRRKTVENPNLQQSPAPSAGPSSQFPIPSEYASMLRQSQLVFA